MLIKVITLRTESANLILIDVKLGGMEKARGWAYKKRMRLEWRRAPSPWRARARGVRGLNAGGAREGCGGEVG